MERSPLCPISFPASSGPVPGDRECFQIWRKHSMPPHIRKHSLKVARIATALADIARQRNWDIHVQEVRASALLHDLGKTYTITHQGNHSQLGASQVLELTGNPAIAQGVIHHVHWPGDLDPRRHFLPLAVFYADKRVKHDRIVTLRQRYEDVIDRYGKSYERKQMIYYSFCRACALEKEFNRSLEVELDAYTFDQRRMVQ